MKKFILKFLTLIFCFAIIMSFTGCGSEAKKAMDTSVETANTLLEKNDKPFNPDTKIALKKAVKDSENAENDDEYKKKTKDINDTMTAYKDSIKQQKQVIKPAEEFLIERAKTVKTVKTVQAATEENDPNGQLNKKGGYYSYIAMKSTMINDSYYESQSPIEAGNDGGAVIEAYRTVKEAKTRDEYLTTFDGSGMLSPGSHKIVGTLVIRTSSELTASQQKELEQNIINALIELK